jgi:hypothetical protein
MAEIFGSKSRRDYQNFRPYSSSVPRPEGSPDWERYRCIVSLSDFLLVLLEEIERRNAEYDKNMAEPLKRDSSRCS